jgi:hypothetical protein
VWSIADGRSTVGEEEGEAPGADEADGTEELGGGVVGLCFHVCIVVGPPQDERRETVCNAIEEGFARRARAIASRGRRCE